MVKKLDQIFHKRKYRSAWQQENEKSVSLVYNYINDQNQKLTLPSCAYKAHRAPNASLMAV